ncbi:RNA polymerase sigma factor [Achromobacter sp. DH1f]|uniref:RNA polymerase sigma factor n=1 Tax=Achromobacter sp. DH1f TaxID=1397275 RepID=UPI000469B88F|nr:RNA polymerase sigma factor [Achromobacter sp. DH1f]
MTNPSDCTTASPKADLRPIRADGDGPGWDTGEEYLLRDLVREHSTRLQRFIIKHIGNTTEAEDLAQQAFVEAARSYRSFRGESQLSSWLYGIALNLVRNYLSRAPERRHDFVSDSVLAEHASCDLTPDRILEQNQTMALLQESLEELPANMRDILLMVGLDDISYEEAAALLTVPIGTVRSRLSRARSALRDKLAEKGLHLDD